MAKHYKTAERNKIGALGVQRKCEMERKKVVIEQNNMVEQSANGIHNREVVFATYKRVWNQERRLELRDNYE